jgi:hypothetical protein
MIDSEVCTFMYILKVYCSTTAELKVGKMKPLFLQSYQTHIVPPASTLRRHEEDVRYALLILHMHDCLTITSTAVDEEDLG